MGTTTRVGTDGDRIASDRKGKGMPATGLWEWRARQGRREVSDVKVDRTT